MSEELNQAPAGETSVVDTPSTLDAAAAGIASAIGEISEPPAGEGTEAPAGEGAEGAAPAEPASGEPAKPVTEAAPALAPEDRAPDTWKPDVAAKWAEVAPEVRAEVLRREQNFRDYYTETRNDVSIGKRLGEILQPFVGLYQQRGIDPWGNLQALTSAHAVMIAGSPQQKVAAFVQLAMQAGIDLPALAQGQYVESAGANRIEALERQLAELRNGVTQTHQTIQERVNAELTENIRQFAADKENHPYFDELCVSGDIERMIRSGLARTLPEAYEAAKMQNPVIRQKIIDADFAKRESARKQTEAARAAKAKAASSANVKSSGSRRDAPKPGTIDETLERALREIHEREAA